MQDLAACLRRCGALVQCAQMPVIVEPNFREHFSIASATPAYRRLLAAAPGEFVGSVSRLAAIVELLSEGVRAAFAEQGLPLPPWRRAKSVMSKWGMGPNAHGRPHSLNDQSRMWGCARAVTVLNDEPYQSSDRLRKPKTYRAVDVGCIMDPGNCWTHPLDPGVPPAASEDEGAPFVSPNKRAAAGVPVPPPPPPRKADSAARRERGPSQRDCSEGAQVSFVTKTGLLNSVSSTRFRPKCFMC